MVSPEDREKAVLAIARERPEIGRLRASRELGEQGIDISPSGVQAIWGRHGLATPYDRLMRRAGSADTEHRGLSDAQRDLLRRGRITKRMRGPQRSADDEHPRRAQLIASATRVFNSKGYERASLREICSAAGILAGSMYRHFQSKEDLFVSVHAEGFRQLNEAFGKAIEGIEDPWRRLEAAVEAHLTLLVGRSAVLTLTVTSLFHTAPRGLQLRLNRERSTYEERFAALINDLPLPPDVDKTLLRLALLGAINWTRIWYRPGRKSPADIAQHLIRNVLTAGGVEAVNAR